MKKAILVFLGIIIYIHTSHGQNSYNFTEVIDLETTSVISQGRTGTCWSFSSTSFLESEIIRLTGQQIDLSEMYTVRKTYLKKAENFVMRQGKAQFSEGGLAHDVLNSLTEFGLVPNAAYSGLMDNESNHNHAELSAVLKRMLETYVDNPGGRLSKKWKKAVDAVLTVYLGDNPESFEYNGKTYTPKSFLDMTKLKPKEYLSITSFSHKPFYSEFILNIPDNWSNGSFINLPLDEMILTIDNALENGFTIELDCDVSEPTFSAKTGVAVIPDSSITNEKATDTIVSEKMVTQDFRQQEFENYATTDDHLMHITGLAKDENGTKYYKVKNSWGKDSSRVAYGGYVYFSESYMRLKAISITIHKDALPASISEKLKSI